MRRSACACVTFVLVVSFACGGGSDVEPPVVDDAPVEAEPVTVVEVKPSLSPAERVGQALRSSDEPLSAQCAEHAPAGVTTIRQWVAQRDAVFGESTPSCRPCAGRGPFDGVNGSLVNCASSPRVVVGKCALGWPGDGSSAPFVEWSIDDRLLPVADSCAFGVAEIQEPLDEDELFDSEPIVAGAPVAGIRYWAEPGELEAFLTTRKAPRPKKTVAVSTTEELLRALANDTLILLAPGRYVFQNGDPLASGDATSAGSKLSPHYVDNTVRGVNNLVIAAATSEPTLLLQPNAYAPVLQFREVDHVGLFGLTIGHRPDLGWCMGDVVRVVHATDFAIGHSTLFGSGTKGISAVDVDGLRLSDSVITDSTEGFADFARSRGVRLERVLVAGNTADLLRGFTIHRSEIALHDVVLKDNHALVNSVDRSQDYGRLFSHDDAYDHGAAFASAPFRVEAMAQTELRLTRVTVDGKAVSWPP